MSARGPNADVSTRLGLDATAPSSYLPGMSRPRKPEQAKLLIERWRLSSAATLGSAVRAKGIMLEVRARLSYAARKLLTVETGALVLRVPDDFDLDLRSVVQTVGEVLRGIERLPVIPREVEDILTITSAERHRWLADGRLRSAGTRTVKLRGRARKITFHVFEPQHIEDVLDRDLTSVWREDDAIAAAENRRRGATKAALVRSAKRGKSAALPSASEEDVGAVPLEGWEEFDRDGLLR